MDDLMQKLQGILSDKESMKQLSELAQMFSQGEGSSAPDLSSTMNSPPPPKPAEPEIDFSKLMALQKIFSKASVPDKNRDFLLALKPLLKEETQKKVDRLITIFRLLNILPIIKEMKLLGGDGLGII